jgi:hypothetical protein
MTSKDRVLTTLAHEEPDRVPVNYLGNAGIDRRLREHFGDEDLHHALDTDFRGVSARYTGPNLHDDKGDIKVDEWGVHRRWVEHESGGGYTLAPTHSIQDNTPTENVLAMYAAAAKYGVYG